MSTQEVFVQQFARLFHHYQQSLAPAVEEGASAQPDRDSSETRNERNRMMAAARLAILEMETTAGLENDSRRYFATPGEAEWGC